MWQPSIEHRDTYPRRRVRGFQERDGPLCVPHGTASRFEFQSGRRTRSLDASIFGETVCILSKLQGKEHIEIEVKMDEMGLTSAESKATYEGTQEYVLKRAGLKVSHLYIAQVKQKYGITEHENHNKPKSENAKQPQCPPEKEKRGK